MATADKSNDEAFQIGGERYIETRFNLLLVSTDKMERALLDRIEALDLASRARYDGVRSEVEHARELLQLAQDNSKRAVDKAEAAQTAHNVASNEWRGTLNDFKATLTSKDEFQRLATDFSAYRLEVSKLIAAQAGERAGTRENRGDTRTSISMIVGVAVGVATLISILVGAFIRPPTPIVAATPQVQQMQVPPGYALVPVVPK